MADDSSFTRSTVLCRGTVERVRKLKTRLIEQFRSEFDSARHDRLIRHAVREAEALAWLTPFPHLFLPMLAEEKLQSAHAWRERQQQIMARGL